MAEKTGAKELNEQVLELQVGKDEVNAGQGISYLNALADIYAQDPGNVINVLHKQAVKRGKLVVT